MNSQNGYQLFLYNQQFIRAVLQSNCPQIQYIRCQPGTIQIQVFFQFMVVQVQIYTTIIRCYRKSYFQPIIASLVDFKA